MNLKIIALALAIAGIVPNAAFAQSVSGAGAGGTPTTINDGGDVAEGATANTACGTDAGGGCTLLQRLARIATNLTALNTTTAGPANLAAAATGGASKTGFLVANNTTGVLVKNSAGTIYSAQLGGIGSVPAWVKIYDSASAPTCGSGTPVKRLIIPANSSPTLGAGSNINFGPFGFAVTNGFGYCVTTGIADADTGAPAINSYVVNFDWN